MRRRNILVVTVSLLLATVVLAQTGEAKAKAKPKATIGKAVIWPAADLKWVDMAGGPPGVQVVDLWGDHTKGAYGSMMKFPAGFSAPLHTHSFDMHIVVVSGTFLHTPEGKPTVKLPAGSYLKQTANYRHATGCDQGAECIFFAEGKGKFDLKPVEEKAPAKN